MAQDDAMNIILHMGISSLLVLITLYAYWFDMIMENVFCERLITFYPSALRAGGVLSSRSGRAGGRAGGRTGGRAVGRAAARLAEPISL